MDIDDGSDKDLKRQSRNLSEKKRRDQFNTLVSELNVMVSPGRKMDKSTVLKTAIALLKKHNEVTLTSQVNQIQENWKPSFLTNEEFIYLLLEATNGFIIVLSGSGEISYISENVISLLGYLPDNLVRMTIFEVAHEAERNKLYNILMQLPKEGEEVSFSCYMRRKEPEISYELVNFVGNFHSDKEGITYDNGNGEQSQENSRLIFMGTGKLETPQLILETPFIDLTKAQFVSRHSLEWKFLFLDHRAPPIIGYLPFELLGTSGYDYYHVDDLDEVLKCHELLMQRGEGTSCYYRFLTKGQQWIWLQTRFYITYHQWNSKPEFVVCSHRVLSSFDITNHDISKKLEDSYDDSNSWSKRNFRKNALSDCTSMSADSPGSRHSQATQNSLKSGESYGNLQDSQRCSQFSLPPSVPMQLSSNSNSSAANLEPPRPNDQHYNQSVESKHYIAALPVPPLIATFPTPVSCIGDIISPAQNQMQIDLQRQHAELQASIEQKQAELRRVSEQLVMARLGMFQSQDNYLP